MLLLAKVLKHAFDKLKEGVNSYGLNVDMRKPKVTTPNGTENIKVMTKDWKTQQIEKHRCLRMYVDDSLVK